MEILHELIARATAETVYKALTEQSGLASWLSPDTTAEPRVGSLAEFRFDRGTIEVEIAHLERDRKVVWQLLQGMPSWENQSGRITWEITPVEWGTMVRFSHGGWETAEGAYASVSYKWAWFMTNLRAYVEREQGRRLPMTENILEKLFEHNNWANLRIIQACSDLSDDQLDAEPRSATKGSIRRTLLHLVASQQGYLSLLTVPVETRLDVPPAFAELQKAANMSGEALLALARDEPGKFSKTQLRTTDGYFVEPWVVMVQAINHATEHREQISSMLSALGITPPDLDGWSYGEVTNALIPIST